MALGATFLFASSPQGHLCLGWVPARAAGRRELATCFKKTVSTSSCAAIAKARQDRENFVWRAFWFTPQDPTAHFFAHTQLTASCNVRVIRLHGRAVLGETKQVFLEFTKKKAFGVCVCVFCVQSAGPSPTLKLPRRLENNEQSNSLTQLFRSGTRASIAYLYCVNFVSP